MTEKQIFGFKSTARLEQIDEQRSERVQHCKHWPKSCDDSAARNESRPDGIFGKDNVRLKLQIVQTMLDYIADADDTGEPAAA
jgi:hypothetical protein